MSLIVPLVLVVLALFLAVNVIKIVPQGREFTVERFGRYTRTLKPGIAFLDPFVEGVGRRREHDGAGARRAAAGRHHQGQRLGASRSTRSSSSR
jgi:regulator of protease activity HflC (stomatin/prohibitin superfamily)